MRRYEGLLEACSSMNMFCVISLGYVQQVVPIYEGTGRNLGRKSRNLQVNLVAEVEPRPKIM
jgi:hypothetical protein